jgi:hypothetical protein
MQKRLATSHLAVESLYLSTWLILSGILLSPIHPIATTSCTKFHRFETKMVDTSVVSSLLQTYGVAYIFFQNSARLHLRNGLVAMFLTRVLHFLWTALQTDICIGLFAESQCWYRFTLCDRKIIKNVTTFINDIPSKPIISFFLLHWFISTTFGSFRQFLPRTVFQMTRAWPRASYGVVE